MAKPDEFNNEVNSTGGSREFTSQEDPGIDLTQKNIRSEYDGPPTSDVSYGEGASGSVSTAGKPSSGGGSLAPFIHPFKLERVLDPDDPNSTKVRVYEGDIYAKIDTFKLDLVTITTGASHTHSAGSYEIPEHTHNLTGQTASGSDGAHTHGGVTDTGGAGSGSEGVHQHGISSNMTGGAHQHDLSSLDTGGIVNKSSNDSVTGTSGTNSNSAATHNIVVIAGQDQPDPVNPISTTWTTAFNKFVLLDDGSNSLFKYHESSHADGDFYVKWVITIDGDAKVQTVVGSIHRVAVGAARPDDNPFGDLTQSNTGALTRAQNTGTFYQKIGTVNEGIVQQKQFSNINWSMTVLPTVS
jgi:hypothetical protein